MAQSPSETLNNRSYLGLLLSQFLAAFNDQATHILAIFFASDLLVRYVGVSWLDDKAIITLVTASFISPFFFFSPIAGVLADKFSKHNIIVFWKLAEIGIMAVALVAFALPHFAGPGNSETLAVWAAVLAISIVFLMGTHSAFFVPAKYGVMPELLHSSILSRGNGLLEGTSFTANILGITFGGAMYSWLGSDTSNPGQVVLGREWVIGLLLLIFAIVGAVGRILDHATTAVRSESQARVAAMGAAQGQHEAAPRVAVVDGGRRGDRVLHLHDAFPAADPAVPGRNGQGVARRSPV